MSLVQVLPWMVLLFWAQIVVMIVLTLLTHFAQLPVPLVARLVGSCGFFFVMALGTTNLVRDLLREEYKHLATDLAMIGCFIGFSIVILLLVFIPSVQKLVMLAFKRKR